MPILGLVVICVLVSRSLETLGKCDRPGQDCAVSEELQSRGNYVQEGQTGAFCVRILLLRVNGFSTRSLVLVNVIDSMRLSVNFSHRFIFVPVVHDLERNHASLLFRVRERRTLVWSRHLPLMRLMSPSTSPGVQSLLRRRLFRT